MLLTFSCILYKVKQGILAACIVGKVPCGECRKMTASLLSNTVSGLYDSG